MRSDQEALEVIYTRAAERRRRRLRLALVTPVVLIGLAGGASALHRSSRSSLTASSPNEVRPTLTIDASDRTPSVGDEVTFTVHEEGGIAVYGPSFESGDPKALPTAYGGPAYLCGVRTEERNRRLTFTWTYTEPGRYTARSRANVVDPCGDGPEIPLVAEVDIDVSPRDG